jgi:hypothetical protein
VDAADGGDVSMDKPERIYGVSHSQLSIARHYGVITFNGAEYHYDAASDMLTRMDVWTAEQAATKALLNAAARPEREKWTNAQAGFDWI